MKLLLNKINERRRKRKGKEKDNEEDVEELDCCKCNCCVKRSITFILIFIIIFSSIGILMHIIYLPGNNLGLYEFIFICFIFGESFFPLYNFGL